MKTIINFSLIWLSVICMTGCDTNKKPGNLKVGYIPIADCAQLYVAIDKGYFKEENLNIELVNLQGGSKILEALAGGSINVGFSNVVSLILSKDAGLDFVSITGGPIEDINHKEHAVIVRKEDINSPSDLQGKTIALNTRKNIDDLMMLEYLEKHGVNINSVKFIEMPFPRMENVLIQKEVDAICVIEPFVTFALQKETLKAIGYYYTELYPKVEISSYCVSQKWLNNKQETAKRFYHAIQKATTFCREHENEIKDIVSKYTSIDKEQIKNVVLPTFGNNLDQTELQSFADRAYQRGWIKNSVNANDIIYSFEK